MLLLVATSLLSYATDVTPARLFSDHAVFQRGKPIPVFGRGEPGESVRVSLAGQSAESKVSPDGRWLVRLPETPAGGPYELSVNGQVVARDVAVGEVWIASGQSNMEWPVAAANDYTLAQEKARPNVRMFTVQKASVGKPAPDVQGEWQPASAATVGGFSAVAYWFAERLERELGVPVGVLHTSWGGTPAESWTSAETLAQVPSMRRRVGEYARYLTQDYDAALKQYETEKAAYDAARRDPGPAPEARDWTGPIQQLEGWKPVTLPATVEAIEGKPIDGAFWFSRTFDWSGTGDATLELGAIDDFDVAYVNGVEVGRTGEETVNWWQHPRSYRVPANALRQGRNTVAVRVWDWGGAGGFTGAPGTLKIGDVSLDGPWLYRVEREIQVGPEPQAPLGPGNPWALSSLYNGMLAPLAPYGVRGAIWYQGESNADRAEQYAELFPAMIQDWRRTFGQGDFPFYFVQLANFMARATEPGDSWWAELRDAQDRTRKLNRTEMATILDVGEADDIHPRNKKDVGDRLARIALAKDYGKRVEYAGPRLKRVLPKGDTLVVEFDHASGLKTTDGRPPQSFAVAGMDGKFVWAEARVEGSRVILRAPSVAAPRYVRYAWADNPDVNLVNGEGLPAAPFRTDPAPYQSKGRD